MNNSECFASSERLISPEKFFTEVEGLGWGGMTEYFCIDFAHLYVCIAPTHTIWIEIDGCTTIVQVRTL